MKLLLENWRLYVESDWERARRAGQILNNIPRWSVVQKGDELFRFTGRSLIPLDHIDTGTWNGVVERSERVWPWGVIHMKRSEMLDHLEEDPAWIKVVLGPDQATQLVDQFKSLRGQIEKDYLSRGWKGSMFNKEFPRNHPVNIDLSNLKVELK